MAAKMAILLLHPSVQICLSMMRCTIGFCNFWRTWYILPNLGELYWPRKGSMPVLYKSLTLVTATYVICASDLRVLHVGNSSDKYADDSYLTVPSSNSSTTREELEHVSNWAKPNNMKNKIKRRKWFFTDRARELLIIFSSTRRDHPYVSQPWMFLVFSFRTICSFWENRLIGWYGRVHRPCMLCEFCSTTGFVGPLCGGGYGRPHVSIDICLPSRVGVIDCEGKRRLQSVLTKTGFFAI